MDREVKWTKYLWLSLLSFGAFMLEYFSIFVIESILLHVDIWNYTANSKSVHCIIMAFIWSVVIAMLLLLSQKYLHFPARENKEEKLCLLNWPQNFDFYRLAYAQSSWRITRQKYIPILRTIFILCS